jgi:hypothetical protein
VRQSIPNHEEKSNYDLSHTLQKQIDKDERKSQILLNYNMERTRPQTAKVDHKGAFPKKSLRIESAHQTRPVSNDYDMNFIQQEKKTTILSRGSNANQSSVKIANVSNVERRKMTLLSNRTSNADIHEFMTISDAPKKVTGGLT